MTVARANSNDKFLVLQGGPAIGGGFEMILVFKRAPSRPYYVWVYDTADEGLQLRAFVETPDKAETVQRLMKEMAGEIKESYWL